jgi:hypothetical protein
MDFVLRSSDDTAMYIDANLSESSGELDDGPAVAFEMPSLPPNHSAETLPERAREFFLHLKELPLDVKRHIIWMLMGTMSCYDYSLPLRSDFKLSAPVAFSPSGKTMLAFSSPKNLFGLSTSISDLDMFDLTTGQVLFRQRSTPTKPIDRFAFSRDGKCVVVAASDSIAQLEAETGRVEKEARINGSIVALSPDGGKFITTRDNNYFLHNTDLLDNLELARDEIPLDRFRSNPSIQFSSNAQLIYFKFKKGLWDGTTGKLLKNKLDNCWILTVSPDSSRIATLDPRKTGAISVYATTTLEEVSVIRSSALSSELGVTVTTCEFSPNNSQLLLAYNDEAERGVFKVWDVESGAKLFMKHAYYPMFTHQGPIVALQGNNNLIFFDSVSGNIIRTVSFSSSIYWSDYLSTPNSNPMPHIFSSPFTEAIYVGLKNGGTEIMSNKNAIQSSSRLLNRANNDDTSWIFYRSLYRLFFMPLLEELGPFMDGKPCISSAFSNEREVFINFRDPLEIANDDSVCFSRTFWPSLFRFLAMLIMIPLYPLFAPILFIGNSCCDSNRENTSTGEEEIDLRQL